MQTPVTDRLAKPPSTDDTRASTLVSARFLLGAVSFVASLIFLLAGPTVWGGVTALALLVVVSVCVSGFELLHPLTWFPLGLFLYSVSHPIMVMVDDIAPLTKLDESLALAWLAMVSFVVGTLLIKVKNRDFASPKLDFISTIVRPIYVVSLIGAAVYLAFILQSGATSKAAIGGVGGLSARLVISFIIWTSAYALLLTTAIWEKRRLPKILLVFTLGFSFFSILIIGERDILLRIIILTGVIIHVYHRRIRKRLIVILALPAVYSVSLLNNFKALFIRQEGRQVEKTLVQEIFGGEFSAAGRNLQTILMNEAHFDRFNGETLWWGIKGILGHQGAVSWFNSTFFPELYEYGGGHGFSLIADGYINFGVIGVVLWFVALGLYTKFLYKRAHTHSVWLIIYALTIPLCFYVLRADMGTILVQSSKHIALPLLIIFGIRYVLDRAMPQRRHLRRLGRESQATS